VAEIDRMLGGIHAAIAKLCRRAAFFLFVYFVSAMA
jgi:hypothetical protein